MRKDEKSKEISESQRISLVSSNFEIAAKNLMASMPDITKLVPSIPIGNIISQETLRAFESIAKQNQERFFAINDSLQIFASMQKSVLSNLDPLFRVSFDWSGIIESQLDFTKEDEFKKFEYNWAGFLTVDEIKVLYDLWKGGKEEEVKDFFFIWFSGKEKLETVIRKFESNDLFKPRVTIITKALEAHRKGDYELSVPILLAQIDGVFIEKHKDLMEVITSSVKCNKCGNIVKSKIPINANNISSYLASKENKYLDNFLDYIHQTFREVRHDIMHGKKLDYADKDLSTKLIATLFHMSHEE